MVEEVEIRKEPPIIDRRCRIPEIVHPTDRDEPGRGLDVRWTVAPKFSILKTAVRAALLPETAVVSGLGDRAIHGENPKFPL